MRSLFGWRRRRSAPLPTRCRRATLAVESLEDRCQPATLVAPDLLTQFDTGVSAYDNLTREQLPVFAGTTTSSIGATIWLFVDGNSVASTTINKAGGGPFNLKSTTPIADGPHVAQFYDSKTHSLSNPLNFTVDHNPPTAPLEPNVISASDPAGVQVKTQGNAGDRLHLNVNGQEVAVVPANGAPQTVSVDFTAMGIDAALPFTITAIAEDSAGNLSVASEPFTYHPTSTNTLLPVVSNALVSPSAISPNGDGVQDDASFRFDLSAAANIVVDFLDDTGQDLGSVPIGKLDAGHQEFQLTVPQFPEGSYALSISAYDSANNAAAPVTASFVIDLTPPELPTFGFAQGQDTGTSTSDGITSITTPILTGFAEPGTTIDVAEGSIWLAGAVAANDGSWNITVPLSDGAHTLAAYATDAAGNSSVSGPLIVAVDTRAPVIDLGPNRSGSQGVPTTLTALVTDASPVTETWELISADNGATLPPAAGPSLSFTPSQPGVYVFRHTAADAAGNVGQSSLTLTIVANQLPTITIPAVQTAFRNTSVPLGPSLVVSDPDSSFLTARLTISQGTIVQTSNALAFGTVLGAGTSVVTLTGSPSTINGILMALSVRFAANFLGRATVQIQVSDAADPVASNAWQSIGTIEYNVVNRPPKSGSALLFSMVGNTTLTASAPGLSSAFSDFDGDVLAVRLVSGPSVGVLVLNSDGSFRYTPPTNFSGAVTFTVRAYDGYEFSSPLTVTINVSSAYVLRRSR